MGVSAHMRREGFVRKARKHTLMNFSRLAGVQMPVGIPSGQCAASQSYSASISAPWAVDDIKPNTKKHVLMRMSDYNNQVRCNTHPLRDGIEEFSAMSRTAGIISSSSRNRRPPSVAPTLPYRAISIARMDVNTRSTHYCP